MKKIKSLTFLLASILLVACSEPSSAAFSSSINIESAPIISNPPSQIVSEPSSAPVVSSVNPGTPSSISVSSEPSSSIEASSSSVYQSSSSVISSSSAQSSSSQIIINPTSFYNGYYDALISWNDGEDLKNQLHSIIRNGYKPLSYTKSNKQNYDTNIHADHSKYDFEYLDVIYSDKDSFKTDTNKGWQREHAWCASLMCGSTTSYAINFKGRATDFHNLFAANASGNQSRGNKNYGYALKTDTSYQSRTVENGYDGYSFDETTFEPANKDKGRLARAIFYMATMYKDDETDTANNINMKGLTIVENPVSYVAGNNCAFAIGNLSELLEWNTNYGVDYLEMQHNIAVYTDANNIDGYAQGNRNPYVDFPALVDYVYGSKKDQPGTINDLVASISNLGNEEHSLSHYAIAEAKRDYALNETLTSADYKVNVVYNDFTFANASEAGISHALNNHTFVDTDGDSIEATINTGVNTLTYQIVLNPMGQCSSGILPISTTGLNKKTPDTDQSVTYGSVQCFFNFSTTYSDVANKGMTINNISAGGITAGSSDRVLTKLIITTKNSYLVDTIFIKAQAGNASSSYSLTIKVGGVEVYRSTVNDSKGWKVFGGQLEGEMEGQISFVFTGSSSLKLNSIAFNSIIA